MPRCGSAIWATLTRGEWRATARRASGARPCRETPSVARFAGMSSTSDGLPVAPSLAPALQSAGIAWQPREDHHRLLVMSGLAVLVGFCGAASAEILLRLIRLVTNFAFDGRFSVSDASPANHHLGLWVLAIPVIGGVIVGLMARYGSAAIRGHGIPEAMERVLYGESKISPKVTFLKPLSAAVAIGTGGPFGAEGPIIATGGALGSLAGQLLPVTAAERKALLAAGPRPAWLPPSA